MNKFLIAMAAVIPVTCAPASAAAQQSSNRLEESIINYCRQSFEATRSGDFDFIKRTMNQLDPELRPVVRLSCMAYMQGGIDALTRANEEEDER